HARHALEQLLYAMRRAFGDDVFDGINPLRLNNKIITSDIAEFRAALARDALAEAVAVYRGPFLAGFFVSGAAEFEKWAEEERARLSLAYQDALRRLVRAAES